MDITDINIMDDDEDEAEHINISLVPEGKDGYACLACGKYLKAEWVEDYWAVIHDNVDHSQMTFNEEDNPQ